ncbi:hypothetical protein PROFUN_04884 [Planoprotostelium fungivorum]|uniref:NmrA-like family domain-containing protein 1 n=1 Tax=Planoprotostelium fungivorum TaxID=1890364 RepID=A0A2P6NF52_9EUKA|nr:hypothetical protein PROFUN_04884 [Planoprotostelium fungivorum]
MVKIITVIGSTGMQGGSVVRHLLERPEWKIRAITRDTEKPAAKALQEKGVEVVKADISDYDQLLAAFDGAHAVFAVTNFWEHLNKEKEVADGKRMADAAKAAGVKHYIWSSLDSVEKITKGKYTKVHHFDGKYEVEEYINQIGLPATFVLCATYYDIFTPRTLPDGRSAITLPVPSDAKLFIIDTAADFGKFVAAALKMGDSAIGRRLLGSGDELSPSEMVAAWKKKGREVVFVQTPKDMMMIQPAGEELWEMFQYFVEYGIFNGVDVRPSQELVGDLESYERWVMRQ